MRRRDRGQDEELTQSASRIIDLTDTAGMGDEVPPEDYPVLVFLRDQLAQAREEAERLRQELETSGEELGADSAPDKESDLAQAEVRDHYERLLDDEQSRRSELQASLESERLLRMEAETKVDAAREELKRVRIELRAALKNERARAVEARRAVANLEEEVARLKGTQAEEPSNTTTADSAGKSKSAASQRQQTSSK